MCLISQLEASGLQCVKGGMHVPMGHGMANVPGCMSTAVPQYSSTAVQQYSRLDDLDMCCSSQSVALPAAPCLFHFLHAVQLHANAPSMQHASTGLLLLPLGTVLVHSNSTCQLQCLPAQLPCNNVRSPACKFKT
jgi:hypothetical protein